MIKIKSKRGNKHSKKMYKIAPEGKKECIHSEGKKNVYILLKLISLTD